MLFMQEMDTIMMDTDYVSNFPREEVEASEEQEGDQEEEVAEVHQQEEVNTG